ncbi:hypothetical protein [uncultured Jatrophihabitans sp.]|uniref:hypothetical protein n=1 Tax=uncultured Jatrophihabitans sp. TaxID=1610747 RepID=UPI0035CACFCF
MSDLVLPAFMMDCRDWMVVSAEEAGLASDLDDVPTVAVLSTMVIDDDIREATGALTVGLLDDDEPLDTRQVAPGAEALELLDTDAEPGTRRYVMPAPTMIDGPQNLALLAEFVLEDSVSSEDELSRRIDALMSSFRWQSVAA